MPEKKLQKNIFKCEALSSKVTFCKMQRTSADNTYTTDAHNSRVNKYLEYSFTIFMLCVHVCVCVRVCSHQLAVTDHTCQQQL